MSQVMLTVECPNLLLTGNGFWPLWSSTEAWKWRRSWKLDASGLYAPTNAVQSPCEGHRVKDFSELIWKHQVVVLVGPFEDEALLHLPDFVFP